MRQEPGSDLFLTQRGGHLSRSGRPESRLRIAQRWVQCYHAGGMAGQAPHHRLRPQAATHYLVGHHYEQLPALLTGRYAIIGQHADAMDTIQRRGRRAPRGRP